MQQCAPSIREPLHGSGNILRATALVGTKAAKDAAKGRNMGTLRASKAARKCSSSKKQGIEAYTFNVEVRWTNPLQAIALSRTNDLPPKIGTQWDTTKGTTIVPVCVPQTPATHNTQLSHSSETMKPDRARTLARHDEAHCGVSPP